MPIVTIQITREGTEAGTDSATPEEKAALIKGVSQLLLDVLRSRWNRPSSSSTKSTPAIGVGAGFPCSTIERSSRASARPPQASRPACPDIASHRRQRWLRSELIIFMRHPGF